MRKTILTLSTLALLLSACGDSGNGEQAATGPAVTPAPAQPTPDGQSAAATSGDSSLSREAAAWTEQTRKLGDSAWEATKESAADVATGTQEYLDSTTRAVDEAYEDAKQATSEAWDATREATGEVYEDAKQESSELYESAREKGIEWLEQQEQETTDDRAVGGATGI